MLWSWLQRRRGSCLRDEGRRHALRIRLRTDSAPGPSRSACPAQPRSPQRHDAHVSLTRHLRNSGSPVRVWLEARFPGTRQAATEANRFIRNGIDACPVKPPAAADVALVGTAVDYLVRAHLTPTALDSTVASRAGWTTQELAHKAMLVEGAAVASVKGLRPWERELDRGGWSELCTACALLAKFEQCFRAGPVVSFQVERALNQLPETDDASAVVRSTVGEETLVDLATLGRAAVADHLDLRSAGVLHLNPTFAQSQALGGADADLVYDHTLLELKAAAATKIVGRRELWQLVGYVLADTHDEYAIEAVGVSGLRWRRRVIWPLDRLLQELVGGPVSDVARLRVEFAQVVQGSAAS